jgi:hypothetical protein
MGGERSETVGYSPAAKMEVFGYGKEVESIRKQLLRATRTQFGPYVFYLEPLDLYWETGVISMEVPIEFYLPVEAQMAQYCCGPSVLPRN